MPTVLQDGQVSWNGLVLGEGTSYGITSISGWIDLPDLVDHSSPRPRDHGDYLGNLLSIGRIVQVSGHYYGTNFQQLHQNLLAACPVSQSTSELRVNIYGQELVSQARMTKRAIPLDSTYAYQAGRWALQFRCPDPRRYGDPQSVSAGLQNNVGGMTYPLTYPLTYGSSPSTSLSLTNSGTADSYPIFTVQGPLFGFNIVDLQSGNSLTYSDNLGSTDVLAIDTQKRQVKLNGTNDRRPQLTVAQWWSVPSGVTDTVKLTTPGAYDPNALLTMSLKPAWW
jgi:hypothetical protein